MTNLGEAFNRSLIKHSYNPNIQSHYLSAKFSESSFRIFHKFIINNQGKDIQNNFNVLSNESINQILDSEKLIQNVTESIFAFIIVKKEIKSAGMLTNFQGEVEEISSRAKNLLAQAQSRIDLMKQEIPKIKYENKSEKQANSGRVECLTYRIVTATKKFKAALKTNWENIKKIEERKKRLTFSKPIPKPQTSKKSTISHEYASVPLHE